MWMKIPKTDLNKKELAWKYSNPRSEKKEKEAPTEIKNDREVPTVYLSVGTKVIVSGKNENVRKTNLKRDRERLEFLTQRHRDDILKLGAAHFDDVGELAGPGSERFHEVLEHFSEFRVGVDEGDFESGRVGIVGQL